MFRRLFALGIALLFVIGLTGCGEETDQTELLEAENLVEGLNMLAMMTNLDAYSGYQSSGPSIATPPTGWSGPNAYLYLPEGTDTLYYEFIWKIPLDSMGVQIDTMLFLLMFTPDIWDSLCPDSIPTQMDVWLIGETRNQIYFHTTVAIPDTLHVTGSMKWNWEETYYQYAYDVSTVNESAEIDITTSSNIGLSAQFRFEEDGSGSTAQNFASFFGTQFVRYEFFAEPDPEGYDGYYELLSEAWKVRHYFRLIDKGDTT
jgi:hypothetical protein